MTFFEQQHVARRNTLVMVVLFVLAVIGVVIAMDAFIASLFVAFEITNLPDDAHYRLIDVFRAVPAPVYLWGAIVTVTLIVVESIRQTFKLRGGGEAIAAAFGARRVAPNTGAIIISSVARYRVLDMPSSIVSFEEFDRRLQAARSTVERLVAECPEEKMLVSVQRQLAAVHPWTRGGRKPEQGEKDSIFFGLITSRFLGGIDDALTGELCELNSYITYWE